MNKQKSTPNLVQIPPTEMETLLEAAACRGARKALKEVGLADQAAVTDIRRLRDLSASIKLAQNTFLQTLVRWLTIAILALLLAGLASKSGLLNLK